jgi:hypothetical protein
VENLGVEVDRRLAVRRIENAAVGSAPCHQLDVKSRVNRSRAATNGKQEPVPTTRRDGETIGLRERDQSLIVA